MAHVSLLLPVSLNPFAGQMSHDEVVLRTLRLALCLSTAFIPLYGAVYDSTALQMRDPFWIRAVFAMAAGGILVATYRSHWVRSHAMGVLTVYFGAIVIWITALVQINDLMAEIAIGYLFTLLAVGALLGLASVRLAPLASFLGGISLIASLVAFSIPAPESSPSVFVLSVLAASLILVITVHARIREREHREEREHTLEEAERLANMGSWSHDLKTSHREWSDGMFRLVGMKPHPGEPPIFFDFIEAKERAELVKAEKRLLEGEIDIVSHTYDIYSRRGIRRRIRSIVRLARSLDGRPARLVGVAQDITAQAEHEQGLEAAKQAAEEAAALKTSILANMSHEIRTPLTAVIGYAQLLRYEVDDDLQTLVAPIERGGERLLTTLNSVLDLSRLESGAGEMVLSPVNVVEEANAISELLRGQAIARDLDLRLDLPEEEVWALSEQESLGRVLTNLVSNAIKFTPEGSVTLRVRMSAKGVQIEVADTGRGIATEFLPRLFEPFHQESTGSARSHEGSGLGLAITQRLVEAMGGKIDVDSVLGEGTIFTVHLTPAMPPTEASGEEDALLSGTGWISRSHEDTPVSVRARVTA